MSSEGSPCSSKKPPTHPSPTTSPPALVHFRNILSTSARNESVEGTCQYGSMSSRKETPLEIGELDDSTGLQASEPLRRFQPSDILGRQVRPDQWDSEDGPNDRRRRRTQSAAASASFFSLPFNISTTNLRTTFGLCVPTAGTIDWLSLYIIYIVTLTAEAARGLLLPSTWPYYESLGGTKSSLGFFVASFSLGRMISTIPLGYLSDNMSIGMVLIIASFIQIIGHFIYATSSSLLVLYIARVMVGFGSATMSVCRAHLTRSIPPNVRTHHFAYLSGLQFIGFAVLPGIGGMLSMLPTFQPFSFLPLNGFTYPAYMLMFANALCMLLIHSFYIDPPLEAMSGGYSRPTPAQQILPDTNIYAAIFEAPRADTLSLTICLIVNIVFRGIIAEFETISVPFLMEQYGITYAVGSYFLSGVGLIGLAVYLCFKPISERFHDRFLVVVGLALTMIGCLPLAMRFLSMRLSVITYVVCLGLTWSIGFPIGQTAILSLFSKILSGLPAGSFLGIFSASGSIARLGMAVVASNLWNFYGREAVYMVMIAYAGATLVLVRMCYGRLQPDLPFPSY